MEVALKLAYEFTRRTRGPKQEPRFLSLQGAYHGDTVGAVSLGHLDLFHQAFAGLLFKSDTVMAPYCYRCVPFNRAKPERADAREYRSCRWECVDQVEAKLVAAKRRGNPYAAFVFEPLMQGAAGMIPQPAGWLKRVTELARGHGALLIADEVMTGFGRMGVGADEQLAGATGRTLTTAGSPSASLPRSAPLFACQHERVQPDFLCLAKGLTGGYLPMAATLTTKTVFDAFLGDCRGIPTFFHGHSFTGNALGAAVALASLELLELPESFRIRAKLEATLRRELSTLRELPAMGDLRQVRARGWRRTGARLDDPADLLTCVSEPASVCAKRWPGGGC